MPNAIVILQALYSAIIHGYAPSLTDDQINDMVRICVASTLAYIQNEFDKEDFEASLVNIRGASSKATMLKHKVAIERLLSALRELRDVYSDIEFDLIIEEDLGIDLGPSSN